MYAIQYFIVQVEGMKSFIDKCNIYPSVPVIPVSISW